MPYPDLKYRVIMGILELTGQGVSALLMQPKYDEQEKLKTQYFTEAKQIAKENEKKQQREQKRMQILQEYKQPEESEPQIDLTPTKIRGGTACLPCSRDHFSTVSGALNEAIRFSRKQGVTHPEVRRRIGMSLDELNMLERIDLSAEETINLKGGEKQLAEWGLENSRNLRHKITQIKSHEDLEKTAALASEIRTKFMTRLWDIITVDGSIDKLCKGLKDEEYKRCQETISNVLKEKTPL